MKFPLRFLLEWNAQHSTDLFRQQSTRTFRQRFVHARSVNKIVANNNGYKLLRQDDNNPEEGLLIPAARRILTNKLVTHFATTTIPQSSCPYNWNDYLLKRRQAP
jgi:hypothetical protein